MRGTLVALSLLLVVGLGVTPLRAQDRPWSPPNGVRFSPDVVVGVEIKR